MFILFSALLCWLMFSPIFKHVLIMRQAVLQKEVDYMLEIGANGSHGYVDSSMVFASKQRLSASGFNEGDLVYTVGTTSGADGTNSGEPVIRGIGITLTITYPYEKLLEIDRLIGITPPATNSLIRASGTKMSEYVP